MVEDFDYADFCALLEANTALNVTQINGMTILQYPRAIIICTGDRCTAITMSGTNMEVYIESALAQLDEQAA